MFWKKTTVDKQMQNYQKAGRQGNGKAPRFEEQRQKDFLKIMIHERSLGQNVCTNMHHRSPRNRCKKKRGSKSWEKIILANFPNLGKETYIISENTDIPEHITMKMSEVTDKENFENSKKIENSYIQRKPQKAIG